MCKFAFKVITQGCLSDAATGRKRTSLFTRESDYGCIFAHAHKSSCGSAPGPRPPESHVGAPRSRGETGPRHVTQAPASPRDGAGRWDALVAAAEASSRVRPAGEAGAGGGGGAGSGLQDHLACGSGPIQRTRLRRAGPGRPGKGGGRGVISGGRPPASPRELRRPRLGAPPAHPDLELPLTGFARRLLGPRPRPGGGVPSPPRLCLGPADPGLEIGAAT